MGGGAAHPGGVPAAAAAARRSSPGFNESRGAGVSDYKLRRRKTNDDPTASSSGRALPAPALAPARLGDALRPGRRRTALPLSPASGERGAKQGVPPAARSRGSGGEGETMK